MKSFDPTNPTNETEKLIAELHEKLIHQVRKYMNRCNGMPSDVVLVALQNAVINFAGAITASCAEADPALNKQLDYVEAVRYDLNQTLNAVREQLKRNLLN